MHSAYSMYGTSTLLENTANAGEVEDQIGSMDGGKVNKIELTANYTKGHSQQFDDWMEIKYPVNLLMRSLGGGFGSHQDVVVEDAGCLYRNRPYYLERLDE